VNIKPLMAIGKLLHTQDNRITQNPMFCVQEKRRRVGLDSAYSDHRCWRDEENDETIFDDDEDFNPQAVGDLEEYGYVDEWFTVMVAFTEAGCKEYIRQNGHNLKQPRIYVESFNRCPEMIAIREALMELAASNIE